MATAAAAVASACVLLLARAAKSTTVHRRIIAGRSDLNDFLTKVTTERGVISCG